MRRQRRVPFFYGWVLVAIGFLTMAVGVNARTAFSLLFPPILRDFGWDSGVTAGVFSFGFLVTPFVGRLMDRRGPRLVIELGIVAMAAGLLLAPLARAPWQLYLSLWRPSRRRRQLSRLYRSIAIPHTMVRATARACA